jgi:hypothetical protein
MNAVAPLQNPANAKLPATYKAAQKALAECSRIDECQEWADKAAALASYARQAKDDQLKKLAQRIQDRAVRRCGELLKQVPADKGGRPSLETQEGDLPSITRTEVATAAGLSEHERKTALRVASISAESFERQVESDNPPTVTALAEQGTRRLSAEAAPPNPLLEKFRKLARFCGETDAASLAASVPESQRGEFRALIGEVDAWLDQFITTL